MVISSEGRIVIVSSALCHMFGFRTSDELIGKNVSMLVPLHHAQQHDGYMKRSAQLGAGARSLAAPRRVEGRHKEGHNFPVRITIRGVEVGALPHFMAVVHADAPLQPGAGCWMSRPLPTMSPAPPCTHHSGSDSDAFQARLSCFAPLAGRCLASAVASPTCSAAAL